MSSTQWCTQCALRGRMTSHPRPQYYPHSQLGKWKNRIVSGHSINGKADLEPRSPDVEQNEHSHPILIKLKWWTVYLDDSQGHGLERPEGHYNLLPCLVTPYPQFRKLLTFLRIINLTVQGYCEEHVNKHIWQLIQLLAHQGVHRVRIPMGGIFFCSFCEFVESGIVPGIYMLSKYLLNGSIIKQMSNLNYCWYIFTIFISINKVLERNLRFTHRNGTQLLRTILLTSAYFLLWLPRLGLNSLLLSVWFFG